MNLSTPSASADAVICGDVRATYGALDRRANQIAHALGAAGVGPGETVGIHARNRVEWIVAGAAFVARALVAAGAAFFVAGAFFATGAAFVAAGAFVAGAFVAAGAAFVAGTGFIDGTAATGAAALVGRRGSTFFAAAAAVPAINFLVLRAIDLAPSLSGRTRGRYDHECWGG